MNYKEVKKKFDKILPLYMEDKMNKYKIELNKLSKAEIAAYASYLDDLDFLLDSILDPTLFE